MDSWQSEWVEEFIEEQAYINIPPPSPTALAKIFNCRDHILSRSDSFENSLDEKLSDVTEKEDTPVVRATFKNTSQAKKRLQAFSAVKQSILCAKKAEKSEDGEKAETCSKDSPKKSKRALYPDERAKAVIQEIEEIKRVEITKHKAEVNKQLLMEHLNKINLMHINSNRSRSRSYSPEPDKYFRKREIRSRNYRRSDFGRRSPTPENKKRSSRLQYPKNWSEYKRQNLNTEKDRKLKDQLSQRDKFAKEPITLLKLLSFNTPSLQLKQFEYASEDRKDTVPFEHLRYTQSKPSVAYSVNFHVYKTSFLTRNQVFENIPRHRKELMEKLFTFSKCQPCTYTFQSRPWYVKNWRKGDTTDCKLLEKSVGLSFLQSYSDEEEEEEEVVDSSNFILSKSTEDKVDIPTRKEDKIVKRSVVKDLNDENIYAAEVPEENLSSTPKRPSEIPLPDEPPPDKKLTRISGKLLEEKLTPDIEEVRDLPTRESTHPDEFDKENIKSKLHCDVDINDEFDHLDLDETRMAIRQLEEELKVNKKEKLKKKKTKKVESDKEDGEIESSPKKKIKTKLKKKKDKEVVSKKKKKNKQKKLKLKRDKVKKKKVKNKESKKKAKPPDDSDDGVYFSEEEVVKKKRDRSSEGKKSKEKVDGKNKDKTEVGSKHKRQLKAKKSTEKNDAKKKKDKVGVDDMESLKDEESVKSKALYRDGKTTEGRKACLDENLENIELKGYLETEQHEKHSELGQRKKEKYKSSSSSKENKRERNDDDRRRFENCNVEKVKIRNIDEKLEKHSSERSKRPESRTYPQELCELDSKKGSIDITSKLEKSDSRKSNRSKDRFSKRKRSRSSSVKVEREKCREVENLRENKPKRNYDHLEKESALRSPFLGDVRVKEEPHWEVDFYNRAGYKGKHVELSEKYHEKRYVTSHASLLEDVHISKEIGFTSFEDQTLMEKFERAREESSLFDEKSREKSRTPDTDEYHSHWESEEESPTEHVPKLDKPIRSWESDEEIFERRNYRLPDRPSYQSSADLEIPLNIKPFSRRETNHWNRESDYLDTDFEFDFLKRESQTLSEERRRLQIEKMRILDLEMNSLRNITEKMDRNEATMKHAPESSTEKTYDREIDKCVNEESGKPKKKSRWGQKPKPKEEITAIIDLTAVKKTKPNDCTNSLDNSVISISSSDVESLKSISPNPLENEYEEFMKAVTSEHSKPKIKKKDATRATVRSLFDKSTPLKPTISKDDLQNKFSTHTEETPKLLFDEKKLDDLLTKPESSLCIELPNLEDIALPDENKTVPQNTSSIDMLNIPLPVPSSCITNEHQSPIVTQSSEIDVPSKIETLADLSSISSPSVKSLDLVNPPAEVPVKKIDYDKFDIASPERSEINKISLTGFTSPLTDVSLDSFHFDEKDSLELEDMKMKPFVFNSITLPSRRTLLDNSKLNLDDSDSRDSLKQKRKLSYLFDDEDDELKSMITSSTISSVPDKPNKPKEEAQASARPKNEPIVASDPVVRKKDIKERKRSRERDVRRDVSPKRKRDISPRRRTTDVSPRKRCHSPRRRVLSPRRKLSPRKSGFSPRRRSRSPRRSISPKRRDSVRKRSISPRRRPSQRKRSSTPLTRHQSPKRRRSTEMTPKTSSTKERRISPERGSIKTKSPLNSPIGGLKRSVADSTISDDLLPQPPVVADDFVESPVVRFDKVAKFVESPKRGPLEERINEVLGIQKDVNKVTKVVENVSVVKIEEEMTSVNYKTDEIKNNFQFVKNAQDVIGSTVKSVPLSSPVVTKTSPIVINSSPVVAKASPIPIKSSPVVAKASPIPIKSSPVVAKASPISIKSSPLVAKANPIPINSSPAPVEPPKSQVRQVGNMIQIVPRDDIPAHVPEPVKLKELPPESPKSTQKIVQVGNVLQVVPVDFETFELPPKQLPPKPVSPPKIVPPPVIPIISPPKEEPVEEIKIEPQIQLKGTETRAEKEKRRLDKEKKRLEKEKKRKERESEKEIKLKAKTENMIMKALQMEVEDEEGLNDPEEYLESEGVTPWPPPSHLIASIALKEAGRSILLKGGIRRTETLREVVAKCVQFADGVRPGEGTSPSGGEDLMSPPPAKRKMPKEKRYKKTKIPKKSKKKKIKVKVVKKQLKQEEDSDEDDNLPPPSPPPGSPPPHIFPPRMKIHTVNNLQPTYVPTPEPAPQTNASITTLSGIPMPPLSVTSVGSSLPTTVTANYHQRSMLPVMMHSPRGTPMLHTPLQPPPLPPQLPLLSQHHAPPPIPHLVQPQQHLSYQHHMPQYTTPQMQNPQMQMSGSGQPPGSPFINFSGSSTGIRDLHTIQHYSHHH